VGTGPGAPVPGRAALGLAPGHVRNENCHLASSLFSISRVMLDNLVRTLRAEMRLQNQYVIATPIERYCTLPGLVNRVR